MKFHILLLVALLAVPSVLPVRADAPKKHVQEDTELEERMDKMAQAWKKLKRQVADPAMNAESLKLVADVRAAADEAWEMTPAKAADIPAAEREKFVDDYQAGIKKLLVELGKLEAALTAGKNDEAVKLVADIGALQKAGHKEFKRPDGKK